MPTTSDVGENIWVTRTTKRNAIRPGKRKRAVAYAAGTATRTTIAVEATDTSNEVFSQARNRSSPSTSPKVDHFHTRGSRDGGVWTTSSDGRKASRSMTR